MQGLEIRVWYRRIPALTPKLNKLLRWLACIFVMSAHLVGLILQDAERGGSTKNST